MMCIANKNNNKGNNMTHVSPTPDPGGASGGLAMAALPEAMAIHRLLCLAGYTLDRFDGHTEGSPHWEAASARLEDPMRVRAQGCYLGAGDALHLHFVGEGRSLEDCCRATRLERLTIEPADWVAAAAGDPDQGARALALHHLGIHAESVFAILHPEAVRVAIRVVGRSRTEVRYFSAPELSGQLPTGQRPSERLRRQ